MSSVVDLRRLRRFYIRNAKGFPLDILLNGMKAIGSCRIGSGRTAARLCLIVPTIALIALALSGVASRSEACVFDAECPLGSRCNRDPVTYAGECVDRLAGGQLGKNGIFDQFISEGVRRRTCSFDVDCRSLGARCLKRRGFLSGVCIGN